MGGTRTGRILGEPKDEHGSYFVNLVPILTKSQFGVLLVKLVELSSPWLHAQGITALGCMLATPEAAAGVLSNDKSWPYREVTSG